jgi:hypothetical protein
MTWYLRKSVSVGPVRFNLSKSGIGTSIGVKGFRVGIRPDGNSYIHAGRNGIYFRENLGNLNPNKSKIQPITDNVVHADTIIYKSIESTELTSATKNDLMYQLNKSYNAFRLDYLTGFLSLVLLFIFWQESNLVRIFIALLGISSFIAVAVWETKRRTVKIIYEFENENFDHFKDIISAFNFISSNNRIWSLLNSRNLYNTHESKLNSGASSIVDRKTASAGEGKPPWVKTNITIPSIKMDNWSLYFMPDIILVYDHKGVGIVEYADLNIEYNTTRFIEESPPRDAKIVGETWRYPNKGGGPDRRFNNNYRIPICLYGQLKVKTRKGLLIYLMTSIDNAPQKFCDKMKTIN